MKLKVRPAEPQCNNTTPPTARQMCTKTFRELLTLQHAPPLRPCAFHSRCFNDKSFNNQCRNWGFIATTIRTPSVRRAIVSSPREPERDTRSTHEYRQGCMPLCTHAAACSIHWRCSFVAKCAVTFIIIQGMTFRMHQHHWNHLAP